MIEFSLLLPTRGRAAHVEQFVRSVVETAACLEQIEVVLCVDADDPASHNIQCPPLAIKTVVVPPGLSMGLLNEACFQASSGRYVMLMNDDVVVRSRGWDTTISSVCRGYEDNILLVHVNDLLFRDKLCTFPILSRQACQAIGVCPTEYHRYRLDDHIFDTYCLLAELGHKRIVYLPDVVFEHRNHRDEKAPNDAQAFRSNDKKTYLPDQPALVRDALIFDAKATERKDNAVRLAALIDQSATEVRRKHNARMLQNVQDTRSVRRPENMICRPPRIEKRQSATVTVAVVTGDLRNRHAQKCLGHLKRHTSNFNLVLLDNNHSANFNHSREMNKVLKTADTDYVVLMDDDVFVKPEWLPGLLKAMDDKTGVVVPMHEDGGGKLSFSGAYLMGDGLGTHAHLLEVPKAPRVTQCVCSALLLIDRRKCGHLPFSEDYSKYFLDIDYSLRVWEAGYQIACTPEVTVTHLGGATMSRDPQKLRAHWNTDLETFVRRWVDSRRLERLETDVWSRHPFLKEQVELPQRILRVTEGQAIFECTQFERDLELCYKLSAPYPLFRSLLYTGVRRQLRHCQERDDSLKAEICRQLLKRLGSTVEVFGGPMPRLIGFCKGYNLVECGARLLAVPLALGRVDVRDPEARRLPGILIADSLSELQAMVDDRPQAPREEFIAAGETGGGAKRNGFARRLMDVGYRQSVRLAIATVDALGIDRQRLFDLRAQVDRLAMRRASLRYRLEQFARNSRRLFTGAPIPAVATSPVSISVGAMAKPAPKTAPLVFRSGSLQTARSPGSRSNQERPQATAAIPREFDANADPHAAELVQRNHAGFDIFYFNTKYFGVPTGLNVFDLQKVRSGELGRCFVGNTIQEVKSDVARAAVRTRKSKALLICPGDCAEAVACLPQPNDFDLQLLVTANHRRQDQPYKTHVEPSARGRTPVALELSQVSPRLLADLQAEGFDLVVLPNDGTAWRTIRAERLAMALSTPLMMVDADGRSQTYKGEDLHRISYNTAYLNTLFRFLPDLTGKTILDVGCSDGLVCNLLLNERPQKIVGIDVLETVGCRYRHSKIEYQRMDGTQTDFADGSFDLCVSIATFEHVPDPPAAFREMRRVTAPGGYCYVQAGPLYYSPFGHHMFGYFDEFPWIHLRRTKPEIVAYARHTGVNQRIRQTFGKDVVRYVDEMINREHVNQKFMREYGINEFLKEEGCQRIFFNPSYEGEHLLTPEIQKELSAYKREDLIAHGFELLFRVP